MVEPLDPKWPHERWTVDEILGDVVQVARCVVKETRIRNARRAAVRGDLVLLDRERLEILPLDEVKALMNLPDLREGSVGLVSHRGRARDLSRQARDQAKGYFARAYSKLEER